MKIFRIEKNTSNLELKKFKKGYYKIIVRYDDFVELEVFCKIDKKTSDFFYFKVEEKDIDSFKGLEELKLGYFVISDEEKLSDIIVVEKEPSTVYTSEEEINNQQTTNKQPINKEENNMTTQTQTQSQTKTVFTVNDKISEHVLNIALEKFGSREEIIEAVNNMPEELDVQVSAIELSTGASELEARICVLLSLLIAVPNEALKAAQLAKAKLDETKEKAETKSTSTKDVGLDGSFMPKAKPEEKSQQPKKEEESSILGTTLKVAAAGAVAYGVYRLVKSYF